MFKLFKFSFKFINNPIFLSTLYSEKRNPLANGEPVYWKWCRNHQLVNPFYIKLYVSISALHLRETKTPVNSGHYLIPCVMLALNAIRLPVLHL